MNSNDVYRPPAAESPPIHSTFSKEEWRYSVRTFVAWLVGLSILLAVVLTTQYYLSLSQFGGETHLARFITLAVFQYAPGVVIGSACNTLAMVTERRAKDANREPVQRVPWSIVGILGSATLLAAGLFWVVSLSFVTFAVGVPWGQSWTGILSLACWSDLAISLLSVVLGAVVLVASVGPTMRLLLRFRGWLILKFIVMAQAMGLLLYMVRLMGKFIS